MGLLDPAHTVLTSPCLFLAAASIVSCSIVSLVLSAMRPPAKFWSIVGIFAVFASALFLAPNIYWTFSLEALGWAGLAYVSFEADKRVHDDREIGDPIANEEDDSGSVATISADSEINHEDVLLELKDRFRLARIVREDMVG